VLGGPQGGKEGPGSGLGRTPEPRDEAKKVGSISGKGTAKVPRIERTKNQGFQGKGFERKKTKQVCRLFLPGSKTVLLKDLAKAAEKGGSQTCHATP